MEESKLEELLKRYWNAETTLEEEKLIEEYIVTKHTVCEFKDLFLDRNAARKIIIPASKIGRWLKVRNTHRYTNAWLRKITAVLAVSIVTAMAVLIINQKNDRAAQFAAQKQLEADLNLMFNTVNDSYNDITSTANYLTK